MMSTAILPQQDTIVTHGAPGSPPGWDDYLATHGYAGFHLRSEWGQIYQTALRHQPHYLWATHNGRMAGVLPLMQISGPIFGKYLASLPYTNTGGVLADSADVAARLIDDAVALADRLDVQHLELRHEQHHDHPGLNEVLAEKVHLRLPLPETADELWEGLKSKVRSQIRKPRNDADLTCHFGHLEQLNTFYRIFCRNMRDLGTPPFPRQLFAEILAQFGDAAEICTVSYQGTPMASALLIHGPGTSMVPSASSLRAYNRTSGNMLMYWHMLVRCVERGQDVFDFGRSSQDAGTYKFKKQWGAEESPAIWQYHSRRGHVSDARPNSGKYDLMIKAWQKLPVWVTKLIGPTIVRGIP